MTSHDLTGRHLTIPPDNGIPSGQGRLIPKRLMQPSHRREFNGQCVNLAFAISRELGGSTLKLVPRARVLQCQPRRVHPTHDMRKVILFDRGQPGERAWQAIRKPRKAALLFRPAAAQGSGTQRACCL